MKMLMTINLMLFMCLTILYVTTKNYGAGMGWLCAGLLQIDLLIKEN